MAQKVMRPELLDLVADRFKALSDRARLSLLQELRGGSCTVNELVEATGMGQANVSRHLAILFNHGLVSRERDGVYVRYELADADVLKLCELVCGRADAERQKIIRREILKAVRDWLQPAAATAQTTTAQPAL